MARSGLKAHVVLKNMISAAPIIFDRELVRARQRRAARLAASNFLVDRAAEDLSDRLAAVLRRFEYAVDVGTPSDAVRRLLAASGKVGTIIAVDRSPAALHGGAAAEGARLVVAADEEALPFRDASLDRNAAPDWCRVTARSLLIRLPMAPRLTRLSRGR